jgi:hypothetical protein
VHPLLPPLEAVNHQRTCIVCPPPLSCHLPPNRPALCPPPHSSRRVIRRPIASPSSAPSTLALHVHPLPSHHVVCRPPVFYLIVVCWIGGDGTWLLIRCLALSAPSLSSFYPPPACFASCSPATHLPYFLIVMYWLMSLPSKDRHSLQICVLGAHPIHLFLFCHF